MTFRDYVELAPGLFVGGHPEPEDPFELGATVVVCLTDHSSVRQVPPGKLFVHWPIKDGPVPPEEPLRNLARLVDSCLGSGAVVYLHCRAGMNRSVLVAARVLMERGMSAEEAIAHVRDRRHGSLSDEYADWLRAEGVHHPRRAPTTDPTSPSIP
jgi:protein-tyrosine phosphatase